MMPCPACKALAVPGSSARAIGLQRVRSRRLLPGERVYQCGDCRQLWRCREPAVDVMVLALTTLETTGEVALPALTGAGRELGG
jgi:hypothetical protein